MLFFVDYEMEFILKYRFFFLIAICIVLNIFEYDDISTIVFFIAMLDLANVMNEAKKDDSAWEIIMTKHLLLLLFIGLALNINNDLFAQNKRKFNKS